MAFRWKQPIQMNQQGKGGAAAYKASVPVDARANMAGYTPFGADNGLGVQAQDASAVMQGYNPTNVYNGRVPDRPTAQGGYGAGYQFSDPEYDQYIAAQDRRQGIESQLAQLETRLQQIDAEIAQIDKELPGVGGNEWDIAAKRAEVGDYSAYDNIVQAGRNQQTSARNSASNIENELYNAAKLTWGLKAKSSEDQEAARNQIEVALRKAETDSAKTGAQLPSIYYELKEKLGQAPAGGGIGFANSRITANDVWAKVNSKTLTNGDIAAIEAQIADDPNGTETETLRQIVDQNRNKTVEKRAELQAEKDRSDSLFNQAVNMSREQLDNWWRGLTEKQKKEYKKYHSIDLKNGKVG